MSQDTPVAPTAGPYTPQAAYEPYHDNVPEPTLVDLPSEDSQQQAWAIFPPISKKSKRDSRRSARTPPPPYTDDPNAAPATIYIFADPSAAEAQAAAARRSVVYDLLVILFQVVLLLGLGLLCYQWYLQFNADWRRTHMHIIKAEAERRFQILSDRAAAVQNT